MKNTLGDLVMRAVAENRDEVTVADVAATRMQDMTKKEFIDKMAFFAEQLGVDLYGAGYVVVNPTLVPKGVRLDFIVDRTFVSSLIPEGQAVFVRRALG